MNSLWDALITAMLWWHDAKLVVEQSVEISHDALHLLFGVLAWLGFALVLRRPISSWYPWLWLAALIGWNEAVDLWTERWHDVGLQYHEGANDLLMTMLVPTIIALAARLRPQMFERGAARVRK